VRDIVSTNSRENSLPTVLTPMGAVGLKSSIAATIRGVLGRQVEMIETLAGSDFPPLSSARL